MSKKEKPVTPPTVDNVTVLPANAVAPAPPPPPPVQERMNDNDIQVLEMGKLTRQIALKEAEKALAENNAAEVTYKYLILTLYMKYGMNASDALDEKGNIHRGVNRPQG